jgi:hypothetical protein
MATNEVKEYPVDEREIPLRRKYTNKKPGNKGSKKSSNSGGTSGRASRALKRAITVSARSSPEQWRRYKAWAESVNEKIMG